MQSSSPDFSSLQELVAFHKNKRAGLTTTLKDPCPKEFQAKCAGPCCCITMLTPRRAADLSYDIKDKWEVARESIELIKVLGQGQYGEVYRGLDARAAGRAHSTPGKFNGNVDVAVKTLKDKEMNAEDFLAEAAIMKVPSCRRGHAAHRRRP